MATEQPRVDTGADNHAGRGNGEQSREGGFRHAIALHEQERRNIDVSKETREHEASQQRKAGTCWIGQHPFVSRENGRRPQVSAVFRRMGFFEQRNGGDRGDDRHAGQHHENQTPGPKGQDLSPERGRNQRRDAEYDRNSGELEASLAALKQIADNRSRQYPNRSGARSLHQAKREQRMNRGGESRARGAEREQSKADRHDRLAAEPVRKRTDYDRRAREARDEDRDRRRRFRLRRMKLRLDQRQARQRHVDRQRRQRGEEGEEYREPETMNVEAGHQACASPVGVASNFFGASKRAGKEITTAALLTPAAVFFRAPLSGRR